MAAGGIAPVAQTASLSGPNVPMEVETLEQLRQALGASADMLLLDNVLAGMRQAVAITAGCAKLEASVGIGLKALRKGWTASRWFR